jgi:hypothetical protein
MQEPALSLQRSNKAAGTRVAGRRAQWLLAGVSLGLVALALLAPLPVVGAPPQERRITISAHTFAFEPGSSSKSSRS